MFDNHTSDDRFSSIDDITASIARKLGEIDHGDTKASAKPKGAKTRFLGVRLTARQEDTAPSAEADAAPAQASDAEALARVTIVEGPGCGQTFMVTDSFTRIGREKDQEIQLAFGDSFISRDGHATIVHYGKGSGFVIRDGMRVNPVMLNNRTLRGDETLRTGDKIRIGATTLSFEAFE